MLEIENEKFENERRAKDQKISVLENETSSLNEKFLILKMEFEEKKMKGQETEGRLKEELKDISEELLALKKKRNQIFIETLEHESKIRRNSLLEQRNYRKNSKNLAGDSETSIQGKELNGNNVLEVPGKVSTNGNTETERINKNGEDTSENQLKSRNAAENLEVENVVSIRVIGSDNNKSSVGKSNNNESNSIFKDTENNRLGINRIGFGSNEKFEDQIDNYNQRIYNKQVKRWVFMFQ
jgi:hypothetical protein